MSIATKSSIGKPFCKGKMVAAEVVPEYFCGKIASL